MQRSPEAAAPQADRSKPLIYLTIGGLWIFLCIAMPLRRLSIALEDCLAVLAFFAIVLGVAASLRARGFIALAAGIEASILLSIASLTFTLIAYVLATNQSPLADNVMASIDLRLLFGGNWRRIVLAFCRHGILLHVANTCYASIQWQGCILIIIACATGRRERCWSFILAWILTLILVVGIFAWLPCLGAYSHFGIPATDVPGVHSRVGWLQPKLLTLLRSDTPFRITAASLSGIVEFPSFHAAAAILFMCAFWPNPLARWPAIILNIGMIVSAVPIGGHYFIDIFGGMTAAAVGLAMTRRIEARWADATFDFRRRWKPQTALL